METRPWIVLVLALPLATLMQRDALSVQVAPDERTKEAKKEQAEQSKDTNKEQAKDTKKEDDLRWYVHVKGITGPTGLTNVVKQLRQVAGVEQVKVTDFKKGVFALTPKKEAELSERVISDAVKKSGFTLEKVVRPKGSTKGSTETKPPSAKPDATKKGEGQGFDGLVKRLLSRARFSCWLL